MNRGQRRQTQPVSRRQFLKESATAASAAALAAGIRSRAYAAGSDAVKLGLVGCGGRGTGAAAQALNACRRARLVAMADAFEDRLEASCANLMKVHAGRIDVPAKRRFAGMDGYAGVIDSGVEMVLLATPPGFRPIHFEAAVEAGKHVFMEKPVAVDAPGVRRMLAANARAKQKGLAVAVGLNIRHQNCAVQTTRRVHEGAIGRINFLRAYGNTGGVWVRPRTPGQTEMEYQMRNWYYFNWLCGDLIVEQTVHAIDLANWAMGDAHPIEAQGSGGRQVRVGPDFGEIYDHHDVEYTYPDGTKMFLYCRHIRGCWDNFGAVAHGAKGKANLGKGVLEIEGREAVRFERGVDGHQVEHDDLFAALDAGKPYNEGDYGIRSTMTAILGRMATYSGQVVTWDDAINCQADLSPKRYSFDAEPPVKPGADGLYPCAMPGVTRPC